MKKLILFTAIFVFLTASCQTQSTETEEVRTTYENYKKAILHDKGEEAVNYLDSRTLKYYADILEKVKKADENTVNFLPITDKLQILMIRLTAKKEQILAFDEKSLVVFSIKNGMTGKNGVASQSLGEVTTEGDFAKAQIIVKNQKTPFFLHFYKENNQWKIDLTSLFPVSTQAFKEVIEESKMSENEYVLKLLEAVSRKKVGKEIWIPTEKLK